MKKLISAAASIAMAASMVGSAVPFVTGAADSSKALELRAFDGASTTISAADIAAGDVTVPVALYLIEGTNDSTSLSAQFTVNSKNGDASGVSFGYDSTDSDGNPMKKIWEPGDNYYSEAKTVNLANGSTASVSALVGFSGKINSGKRGDTYLPVGTYTTSADTKSKSAGTDNAYAGIVWITATDGSGYEWVGSKSDDYPVAVVDVNFPKGTPAGEYTLDFLDYVTDPAFPDNYSNMIEANGKYTTKNGKLSFKGLTITIEGDIVDPVTTTAPAPATTAAAPATTTAPATTAAAPATTVKGDNNNDVETASDFIVKYGEYTAAPGDTIDVEVTMDAGPHKVATLAVEFHDSDFSPAGIKAELGDPQSFSFAKTPVWTLTGETYYLNTLDAGDPVYPIDDVTMYITLTIPEDAPAGDYEFDLTRFYVVEQGTPAIEFNATQEKGVLHITGDNTTTTAPAPATTTAPAPATTTAPAPATTTAPAPATTTAPAPATTAAPAPATTAAPAPGTTAAPAPATTAVAGTPNYGDANVDGKVNIADVVVLNKWLNDAKSYNLTDQGKLNADCCDPKAGAEINAQDSDAIIKSIVHLVTLPAKAADLG